MPTFAPVCDNATARFAATVDLPTPPLPDATGTMFLTPGIEPLPPAPAGFTRACGLNSAATPATESTAPTAAFALCSTSSSDPPPGTTD